MKRWFVAQAAGFKPIRVTSLVRLHVQPDGTIESDLLDYAQATRDAAAEAHAPLVDLHDLSIPYFEKLGKAQCERLASRDPKAANKIDATHLSEPWHQPVATLVIGALVKVEPELAGRFKVDSR